MAGPGVPVRPQSAPYIIHGVHISPHGRTIPVPVDIAMDVAVRAHEAPSTQGRGFGDFRSGGAYRPPSPIPCTAGMVPSRPFWKSSNAC